MTTFDIVAVGCSWGGLEASSVLLSSLHPDMGAAVVITQHRPADPRSAIAQALARKSALPIRDAEDKEPLEPGVAYLAPPDYHLLVERGALALSTEAAVQFARPSVDVLFESVAHAYGPRAIGVVLTGANDDGAAGLARIKARGGLAVVQDPATAVRSEMPRAALAMVVADAVLPLEEIGPFILSRCVPARSTSGGVGG